MLFINALITLSWNIMTIYRLPMIQNSITIQTHTDYLKH